VVAVEETDSHKTDSHKIGVVKELLSVSTLFSYGLSDPKMR